MQEENIWSLRDDFLKINLAGTVPVLVEDAAETTETAEGDAHAPSDAPDDAPDDAPGADAQEDEVPAAGVSETKDGADAALSDGAPSDGADEDAFPAPSIVVGSATILEYLEETQRDTPLLPETPVARAEARRVQSWFDEKFYSEVSGPLIFEKIESRKAGLGAPNMQVVRRALENMHYHLEYIGYLIEDRRWLAGDLLSAGDLAAAAHLSLLDYLGDVPWHKYNGAKEWYVRIKSRPSFRPLLAERIAGMPPSRHYANLDF